MAAIGLALALSLLLAALVVWRGAHLAIALSAKRAVLNAKRMINRTAIDLQKLDGLRLAECTAETVQKLKDSVYHSISQVREIGLIQKYKLFCTNFGGAGRYWNQLLKS